MDKFRGTATSRELVDWVARDVTNMGFSADQQAMSDGGEGFIDTFSGRVVEVEVAGPLGATLRARIKLVSSPTETIAVAEVSDAVGRDLLPSPKGDEAMRASSEGVGQLLLAAANLGADRALVGCGGTVTSDGGLGCYQILRDHGGLPLPVTVATDVTARFFEAVNYARQKGVRDVDLPAVEERLRDARARYLDERGVDVETVEGSGAAGGIPGALAALGATLTSGVRVVVDSVDLIGRVAKASLVITGEGRFDAGSLEGKVPVGVAEVTSAETPLLLVCGSIEEGAAQRFQAQFPNAIVASLEARFGLERAMNDVHSCVSTVIQEELRRVVSGN